MEISDKLSGEKFTALMVDFYRKGEETEQINTLEFINEIAEQIMIASNKTAIMSKEKME